MIKKHLINICMAIALLCGFNSCEDDPYYEDDYYDPYEEISYNLCYNIWVDVFDTPDSECEQQLSFHPDGRGMDTRRYFYPNGLFDEDRLPFYWELDAHYPDIVYMNYEDRTTVLEHVRITPRTLNCLYDGERVEFIAK